MTAPPETAPPDTAARPARPPGRRALPLALGAALAAAVGVGLYAGAPAPATGCAGVPGLAARLAPLARGGAAMVRVLEPPVALPALAFNDPSGAPTGLDALKGRAVLLNLWATWCAPCRAEMPALDALQAREGDARFEVVAVNIDTRRDDRAARFLDEAGVKALARYADPSADLFQALRAAGQATGMPTTLLIDAKGCAAARVDGPLEWDGPDAAAVVRALKGTGA